MGHAQGLFCALEPHSSHVGSFNIISVSFVPVAPALNMLAHENGVSDIFCHSSTMLVCVRMLRADFICLCFVCRRDLLQRHARLSSVV